MADWARSAIGDMPVHQAKAMAGLPGILQGFTTRQGGVSRPPYQSLNLGGHVGDDPAAVEANRTRLWTSLGIPEESVVMAEQVHGSCVAVIASAAEKVAAGADALVTDVPDIALMLLFADCVPVYLVDPVARVIGLAHSGWRGTAVGIAAATMTTMRETFGCAPGRCLAAIGPCIGGSSYVVGVDVVDRFRHLATLGAATALYPRDEFAGTYTLNLRQIIFAQLLAAGLRSEAIAVSEEDTFRNRREFFSYRRDGASSGRMAAFLALQTKS